MPTVTVHPNGEVIYLDPDETVLSGLYRAGDAYTVGCRRIGSAVCKVDLLHRRQAPRRRQRPRGRRTSRGARA